MLNFSGKSDHELMKHMCKLCNKSFPCGRSLGGHMRSHVIISTDYMNNNKEVINGCYNSKDLGYELRKDPKKTLKAVINHASDSSDFAVFDKLCKQCGKGFQSWKALFGHMKCHSDKVLSTKTMICDQYSWINEPENKNSGLGQMKKSRSRNGAAKRSIVSYHTTPSVTTTTSTSVVSDIYDEQEAEIAMCLIMLSRDVGKWDNKMRKSKKTSDTRDGIDDQNKRKFECATCNKSFNTYQALGGHQASHKKLKGCLDSVSINKDTIKSEPMLDNDHMTNGCCVKTCDDQQSASSFNLDGSLKITKVVGVGAYECSICLKVFTSGQALGGHKRSHLIAEAKLNQQNLNLVEKVDKPVCEIQGFFDLNMLPDDYVDEEQQETMVSITSSSSGTGYKTWCHNNESTSLGLISTS